MNIYETLKEYFNDLIDDHQLADENIQINCKALSAKQAIGTPERDDYPIIKGREVMVEAVFRGARGQAFTDEFEDNAYTLRQLVNIDLDSNRNRASFVSGLNAVMRFLGLCDRTIHCRDQEPKNCASQLKEVIPSGKKVALIGYQPGFLAALSQNYDTRVVDLDQDNIGKTVSGVTVKGPEESQNVIDASDMIFVTGSTLVNGTITNFLNLDKPVVFFGVTISGAARILNLETYCRCGH